MFEVSVTYLFCDIFLIFVFSSKVMENVYFQRESQGKIFLQYDTLTLANEVSPIKKLNLHPFESEVL